MVLRWLANNLGYCAIRLRIGRSLGAKNARVNSPAPARGNLVRSVPRIPISTTKDIQKLPRHTSSFLVAGRHSLGFRRQRIVRERSSFIEAEGSALGLCNQRVNISAAECYLGLRPKCLICGDDVFTSSTRCCLAASLYGLNVT